MIRIAVLDDHPAVLAGLKRLVERQTDLEPVAFVETARELDEALHHHRADVVVVDYDLARGDGLAVCQRLKERARPPRVVIYSAYAGPALAVATRLAHADGLVNKSDPISDLLSAVRRVAGGEQVLPSISPEVQHAAVSRLEDEDVAVAAMLLAGTPHLGISETLGLERGEVVRRAQRVVARTRPQRGGESRRWEDAWSAGGRAASPRATVG